MRCGMGWATDKSEGIKWERKERRELHSSSVWPPDVCLQLSGGCWCWLRACSWFHRVQICCLGGTLGASKTDRTESKTALVKENLSPLSIIYSFLCTVGFSKAGLHSQHRGKRCSDLKVVYGRQYQMNSNSSVAVVREWVDYRKEVAVLRSHIPVCNDNQAERRSAL